ncbi:MAG: YdeI/OmpD-associated family protein [Bacteroidia bacterium]|nr:YdeI/OmpD-associated family protein [Bacteroidia bacterium]
MNSINIPSDLNEQLQLSPEANAFFEMLPPSHKSAYLEWIESAKKQETRMRRIAKAIEQLQRDSSLKKHK